MPITQNEADTRAFALYGHRSLARQPGQPVPGWLRSVWAVLEAGGRGQILSGFFEYAEGLDSCEAYKDLGLHDPNPDRALALRPSEQVRQLLGVLQCAWADNDGLPQTIEGQDPLQARLQVALWRQQALRAIKGGKLGEDPAPNADTASITLPIMLVQGAAHGTLEGCVAQLRLTLVHCPGASLHLLPSLAQASVPMVQSFTTSLATVTHLLRETVPAAAAKDMALVWDLMPLNGGYHLLAGPSASAAFGLGALWLLRQDLPAPWREPLTRLARADFNTLYLSAELRADGALAPVGGIDAKDQSLALARAALGATWGRERPLYVAANQPEVTLVGDQLPLQLKRHGSLLDVVKAVVARPMTPAQTTLYNALGEALAALSEPPGAADSGCPNHLPPQLNTTERTLGAALAELDSIDPNTHRSSDPLHYALRSWAQRGRSLRGQRGGNAGLVHQRFVNLQLIANSPGSDRQIHDEPFNSLEQMLADFEQGKHRADCPSAFLIEGEPGSGKSFLMARHEQALCEQYIWHDHHPGEPLERAPVLPLYLPLNLLPPDDDPVAFYRQWLLHQYPYERLGLAQRLDPARRAEGPAPYRLRLMIDGLNEVQAERSPELRAKDAVIQLWQAFAPDLPLVLGIRPHREWNLDDPVQRFNVRSAELKAWTRLQIQSYLDKRWGQGVDRVVEFMTQLPEGSAHETLLGTPLFLNLQCELWEAGAQTMLANRAHLLAAMLWLRLGQELDKATVKGRLQGPLAQPGMVSEREGQTAKEFLQSPGQPPEFPRQGWLLKGLFVQAKAQWLAKPEADAQTRGQVVLPQSRVERSLLAAGLPEDALADWFKALQELGLARLERVGDQSERQFRYEHQVFGEWLASAELFYSGAHTGPGGGRRHGEQPLPEHWSAEALARLAAELAPTLNDSAEASLQAQRQRAAEAWGDNRLDDLLDGWRDHGLSLPLSEVQGTLDEAQGIRYGDSNMLDTYQHRLRWIQIDTGAGQCAWRFDAFARALVNAGLVKAQTGPGQEARDAWHQDRAAWAAVCQHSNIWPVFQEAAKQAMAQRVGQEQSDALWGMGRLGLPPPGALDDIAPLALDALDQEAQLAWLGWLVESGPWALASTALVHTRERLRDIGKLGPVQAAAVASLWASSAQRLLAVVNDAGAVLGAPGARRIEGGADPRQRLQAGQLLGAQGEPGSPEGDHVRFECSGPGLRLRLRPAHWLLVGGPSQRFRLGDPACGDDAGPYLWVGDGPDLPALPAFYIAQLPVTVAEYQRFIDGGGYGPAQSGGAAEPSVPVPRWWQAAGPAAVDWLQKQPRREPVAWGREGFSNPLQPATGVSWYEAQAYCHWAAEQVYADRLAALHDADPTGPRWVLRLPTEWEWEAAMRGPHTEQPDAPPLAWPGHGPQASDKDAPSAMLFNHSDTGWARPSPVGCWGASRSVSGLLDGVGNVWSWCANVRHGDWASAGNGQPVAASKALSDELRALRGGSCDFSASRCRVGNRNGLAPDDANDGVGFRLVLSVVL